jgi:hypothetical protein
VVFKNGYRKRGICAMWFDGISRAGGRAGMGAGTVQEELSCFGMRCDALEEREGIAYAVRHMCSQVRRGEHWIDGDNLLEEGWHDTWCAR